MVDGVRGGVAVVMGLLFFGPITDVCESAVSEVGVWWKKYQSPPQSALCCRNNRGHCLRLPTALLPAILTFVACFHSMYA